MQSCPRASLVKRHAMNAYGEWKHSSPFLDLLTRWMWVVSATAALTLHGVKDPTASNRKESGIPVCTLSNLSIYIYKKMDVCVCVRA
jgi:hypothetical protein